MFYVTSDSDTHYRRSSVSKTVKDPDNGRAIREQLSHQGLTVTLIPDTLLIPLLQFLAHLISRFQLH